MTSYTVCIAVQKSNKYLNSSALGYDGRHRRVSQARATATCILRISMEWNDWDIPIPQESYNYN